MAPRPRRRAISIAVNAAKSQVSWVGITGRRQRSLCGDRYRCCSNRYISVFYYYDSGHSQPPDGQRQFHAKRKGLRLGPEAGMVPDPCRSSCVRFRARGGRPTSCAGAPCCGGVRSCPVRPGRSGPGCPGTPASRCRWVPSGAWPRSALPSPGGTAGWGGSGPTPPRSRTCPPGE